LVRVLPALKTLVVEKMDEDDAVGLSQSLREHCPHLRANKHPKLHQDLEFRSVRCTNSTMMLVDACIHGNLTHLSLDLDLIDTYVKDTILKQAGGGLKVLELVLRGRNTIDASFVNLSRILEQSKRLKRVWIRNGDYDPFHIFRSITTEFLKGLRCCQELENLTMIGFFGTEEEDGAVDRENDEQAESEQQQQMTTTSTTGDNKVVTVSKFTLPPRWLKTKGSYYTSIRRFVPLSSNFLKARSYW
ncbi:hypothetical protein BGX24_003575, partial [Mortierella sp. AD032]